MEKSQFDFWVASPIKQKQPHCFNTLRDLIRATCLRRTKDMTQNSLKLPGRIERIEEIKLHQADQVVYDFFREKTAKIAAGLAGRDSGSSRRSKGKGSDILTLINFLRRICNHGLDLLPRSALEAWRSKNNTSVDWQMMQNCNKVCDLCGSIIEEVASFSDDIPEFHCHHSICTICSMQSGNTSVDEAQKCPKCAATRATSGNSSSKPEYSVRLSAKVEALMKNLDAERALKHHEDNGLPVKRYLTITDQLMLRSSRDFKMLIYCSIIFSHWTKMLDVVAKALTQHGFLFQRIDGQSSLQQRDLAMQQFNEDPTSTVMLASIGSAGEG
jgi:SNF2 family DNA or RNA helicase